MGTYFLMIYEVQIWLKIEPILNCLSASIAAHMTLSPLLSAASKQIRKRTRTSQLFVCTYIEQLIHMIVNNYLWDARSDEYRIAGNIRKTRVHLMGIEHGAGISDY